MILQDFPMADTDSAPWWEALQRHELLIQRCGSCTRLRWPARAICNDCHCADSSWINAIGSGTVASWTVTHRPGKDEFVVALVRLDDQNDILIPGYIDGPADGSGLSIGMPVHVGFDQIEISDDGWKLAVLRWRRGD